MERRRSSRLDINLPCRIVSPKIGWKPLVGTTENMSRGDVLILLNDNFQCMELPRVGDPLVVEIELPENHAFGRKCMQCQTTVVRVSQSETGSPRMALRINKMRFESYATGAVSKMGKTEAEIRQLLM